MLSVESFVTHATVYFSHYSPHDFATSLPFPLKFTHAMTVLYVGESQGFIQKYGLPLPSLTPPPPEIIVSAQLQHTRNLGFLVALCAVTLGMPDHKPGYCLEKCGQLA